MRPLSGWLLAGLTLAAAGAHAEPPALAWTPALGADLHLSGVGVRANDRGPLALAQTLQPAIAGPSGGQAAARLEWRADAGPLHAQGELETGVRAGGLGFGTSGINELTVDATLGAWHGDWLASIGRKVVGWDVGYAWRPNDLVQQAPQRKLLSGQEMGRPLLQLERFDADAADAWVLVNPHHARDALATHRGAAEAALAWHHYLRDGPTDWHAFARWGRRTEASLGAALAWVANDSIELHASARALQRHDRLRLDPAAGIGLLGASPWSVGDGGFASQVLLGAQWTGERRQSLQIEAWFDGTAPSDPTWRHWGVRSAALAALGSNPGLAGPAAGNLGWQAEALSGLPEGAGNLRRRTLYARAAWQPEGWTLAADALLTPADRGLVLGASLAWQGDRWRVEAAWRRLGGAASALLALLPQQHQAALGLSTSF
jgi:hypothetical protein